MPLEDLPQENVSCRFPLIVLKKLFCSPCSNKIPMYILYLGFNRIFFLSSYNGILFSNKILQRNPMYSVSKSGGFSTWKEIEKLELSPAAAYFNTGWKQLSWMLFKYCTIASLWMKNNLVCVSKWSRGIETKRALSQVFYTCWIWVIRDIHCKMGRWWFQPSQQE